MNNPSCFTRWETAVFRLETSKVLSTTFPIQVRRHVTSCIFYHICGIHPRFQGDRPYYPLHYRAGDKSGSFIRYQLLVIVRNPYESLIRPRGGQASQTGVCPDTRRLFGSSITLKRRHVCVTFFSEKGSGILRIFPVSTSPSTLTVEKNPRSLTSVSP
jgi:hypothetical protein